MPDICRKISLMPRRKCRRRIGFRVSLTHFKPAGVPMRELTEVVIGADELEAVRLADLEGMYQEQAAAAMGVSRQTFGRILASAHRKIADGLVNGRAIRLDQDQIPDRDQGGDA